MAGGGGTYVSRMSPFSLLLSYYCYYLVYANDRLNKLSVSVGQHCACLFLWLE